ncbi:MAG: SUMF1/EgtB/PvdO family nonheme iron enzyme [Chlorobiaceae bacterium]|nr:SUMF1/EgtB/PvdO family nonheme iron enzyme [Chlorobiaceae bacterium]
MADKRVKIVKVLIASPGDVVAERKIAQEVINEWNNHNAERCGVTLQAILWETDTASEMGARTQEIINEQIVNDCDCAIGIFWNRIGTDTGVAPGGAVEEIDLLQRKDNRVMLYFSGVKVDSNTLDLDQLAKLRKYKASLQKEALITEYEELHEFKAALLRQLGLQVRRWFCDDGGRDGSEESRSDNIEMLRWYHAALKEEVGYIRMLGMPDVESIKINLNDDTFVPLRFSGSQRRNEAGHAEKMEPLLHKEGELHEPDRVMQQAFRQTRMLLVIGDPGAGKTTLLSYYVLSALDGNRCSRLGFSVPLKVFYLKLREIELEIKQAKHKGEPAFLHHNLAQWAVKKHKNIEPEQFKNWLDEGTSLVLLDGLDEISDQQKRIAVCRWIDGAVDGFQKAFFVVTSRGTGYRKEDGIELECDYERADVQDFSTEQQERFLRNWFRAAFLRELGEGTEWQKEADERTKKIIEHLEKSSNRGLRQLAAIPMILQIMAILWKERDYLPETREKLYSVVLDYLLEQRDKRRGIYLLSANLSRKVLGPVSFWMQKERKSDAVERAKMQKKMKERLDRLKNPPDVTAYCDFLVKRAGLLVEYGKDYLFRHKSFREYLAGVELLKKVHQRPGCLDTLIAGFDSDWWDEPLRFFIAQSDDKVFDLFMKKLFASPVSDDLLQKKMELIRTLIDEAPLKKVDALCKQLSASENSATRQLLILECIEAVNKSDALDKLLEFRAKKLAVNDDVFSRQETVILAFGGQPLKRESEKSVSGKLLSRRNEHEQNAEYILIPAGSYIYSATKKEVTVEELYVAKYPVTNRLYRSFISSLQVKDSNSELFRARLDFIATNNIWDTGFGDYFKEGKGDLATLFRSKRDDDRKFGGDDQPVVSITWYAAQAYCLWLSLLEGSRDNLYSLPTEIEREWAAGGQRNKPKEVLNVTPYPWGKDDPTPKHANYGSNIGSTTPVSRYPEGMTPEGLYDMAGNVWEWMENRADKDKDVRALRGGSLDDDAGDLRGDSRTYLDPAYRNYLIGFRVVRPGHFS